MYSAPVAIKRRTAGPRDPQPPEKRIIRERDNGPVRLGEEIRRKEHVSTNPLRAERNVGGRGTSRSADWATSDVGGLGGGLGASDSWAPGNTDNHVTLMCFQNTWKALKEKCKGANRIA